MISSSHSVIYRLTPPTCTLEICGRRSPLSKWTNNQIVKDIRFKLSFDDPTLPEEQKVTFSGDREKLEAIYNGVLTYVETLLKQSFPIESFPNEKINQISEDASVYVIKKDFLSHQLFIEDLENSPINLSTIQLFDLVSALEDYKSKIETLPGNIKQKSHKTIPLWVKGVAGLALVVGMTTIGTKIVQQQTTKSESIATKQPENSISQGQFDNVIPPQIPSTETPVIPEPEITEPLSSAEKLPSPPAVDTPKPPPDIPDPAKYPIPEGNLVIPPPISSPEITEKSQPNPNSSQVESRINITSDAENNDLNSENVEPKFETQNNPSTIARNINPNEVEANNFKNNSNSATSEELLTASPLLANNNALDTGSTNNNQLKEVKEYFTKNWQPPKELKQTIEYRLIINADGSIKRIFPIGKASEIFLDRTNIPLMGENFVSPLKQKSQVTVRLLLSPDGKVTTFLE